MSQNCFEEIKSVFQVADYAFLQQDSRISKVKPIYDMINKKIAQFGILHESLTVDESMVPYFGWHLCKQFIKSKPICFGFKLWVLTNSAGTPYNLHIYEGKPADQNEDSSGLRVVKRAIAVCKNLRITLSFLITSPPVILLQSPPAVAKRAWANRFSSNWNHASR